MQEFYARTGNHKLRFKPAYNPYTEVSLHCNFKEVVADQYKPSMEIFSWHEGLGKWMEIANVSCHVLKDPRVADLLQSGIFRPEMLEPMGLPKGVRVLGWGMSLERPTMIKRVVNLCGRTKLTKKRYKIQDIRTLVGHKTDLALVRARPAVRLEKGDE